MKMKFESFNAIKNMITQYTFSKVMLSSRKRKKVIFCQKITVVSEILYLYLDLKVNHCHKLLTILVQKKRVTAHFSFEIITKQRPMVLKQTKMFAYNIYDLGYNLVHLL